MGNDILIVGSGPAGVSCSFFLKKFDKDNRFNVELIDRLNENKYELYHDICGEAVSKDIVNDIKPLKLTNVRGKISKIIEHWPSDIKIETKMEGYLINRSEFFHSTISKFKEMGGKFNNQTLRDINYKNDKIKVKFNETTKKYDYVVAADGANSLVRKKMGISGNVKNYIQYIVEKKSNQDFLEFFYDEKYKGDYKWMFPHGETTKIGFPHIPGKKFSVNGKILKKQARAIGYGGVNKYVAGNILFIGDAACQTNPITKGGIRPAMVAGKKAAYAIISNNPKKYESEWNKTDFASNIFQKSFEKLKKMDNESLIEHIKPLIGIENQEKYKKLFFYIKILLKYPHYLDIYRSYNLSNKVGW